MISIAKRLQPLYPYLWRYRRRYLIGFGVLLCDVAFWLAIPMIIKYAIDDLQQGATADKLVLYIRWLLVAALGKAFFLFWKRIILIGISREAEYDLRNDLYRHLNRLSLTYFQRNRTGDLMSRATNDMNAVRMLLGPGIMYSLNTVVTLLAALGIMLSISPKLTFYCFLLMPVVVGVVVFFGRRIHERFESIQALLSTLSAKVQESLAGIRVVRAYAQEEAEIARFQEANEEYVAQNMRLVRLWGMFYPSLEVLLGLTYVMVLWMGGREVVNGNITIGSFVAFNAYMGQLTWPMIAMGWVVNLFQRGTASLGRLNQILTEEPEIADRPDLRLAPSELAVSQTAEPLPVRSATGSKDNGDGKREEVRGVVIEFRNLSFSYNGRQVLHKIDLTIPAGSTLAIVGPTGSGKSTLVHLIPRLYEAPPGSVYLGGKDICDYRLEELRRMIGFVQQETFLFSETIRENIAFGVNNATDGQIHHAAEIGGLLSDVEDFPMKFGTIVGERGITLSGGQKQRTAIARAVLRNPKLLVLDDALSSVDTYTEEIILNRLASVMRGRTTILISHRISTVRGADQIVVLREGSIVERGTHQELLGNGSYYQELYQRQLLEEELERA
ncbi:MAG: ABC transporter ATP-binding protein [Acidobacteria bacterium]|nr:ABC transporter ATP-binding protein [Acidobacteriota bacterium]